MLRLIKAELFKLSKNKTLKVVCIVSICLSLLMLFMCTPAFEKIMEEAMKGIPAEQTEQMMSMLDSGEVVSQGSLGFMLNAKDAYNPTVSEVFHSSFGVGVIEVLVGIFIAAFLAKEYTEGTIKNTLAYGRKRSEVYLAKFVSIVVGIAMILLALTIIPTVGSAIINGWGETFEISQLVNLFATFIAALVANAATAAIIMIIAIAVKSNGATIGITFGVFSLLPMLISFLYGINNIFDKIYEITPWYNNQLATSIYATNGDLVKSVIISIITMIIALFAGIQIFKKQDIK